MKRLTEALTAYFKSLAANRIDELLWFIQRAVDFPGLGIFFLRASKGEPALVQFKNGTCSTPHFADWLTENDEFDAAAVGAELLEETDYLLHSLKTKPYVLVEDFGSFERVIRVSRVFSEESQDWSYERSTSLQFLPSPLLTARVNSDLFPYEVASDFRVSVNATDYPPGMPWAAIELLRHHLPLQHGTACLERFLKPLTNGQCALLAIDSFRNNLLQLGFFQYLYAAEALLLPRVWQSFNLLNAEEYANIALKVLSLFPEGEYPLENEVRRQAMTEFDSAQQLTLENLTRQMIYLFEDEPIENFITKYMEFKGEELFTDLY